MAKRTNNKESDKSTQEKGRPSSPLPSGNIADPKETSNKDYRTQYLTQIIVAIIGLVGAVVAAIINRSPEIPQVIKNNTPSALISFTNTPSPTSSLLTETPVPPTATQPSPTPTQPGYYEDFSQGANWLPITTPISGEKGIESRYIADGVYHWDVQTVDNHIFGTSLNDLKLPNFEYEVVFHKVEMSNPRDDYGIRFRSAGSAIYIFYINNNGEYGLSKYLYKEDKYLPPVERTQYPLINKNGSNTLKVIAQGESIHLYINGQLVDRVLDKSSLGGGFSLWTWLPHPNDSMKMEVSRLSIIPINLSTSLDTWPTQLADTQSAELQLSNVDDEMTVWINGKEVITSLYGDIPSWIPILDYLQSGDNIIEISIRNGNLGDCNGRLRLRLNGIINSAYQWFWDNEKASKNIECFHEKIVLPLK